MATPSEILQSMIDSVDDQVDNLNNIISSFDVQISDLNEQIDGVQNGLCEVAKTDLTAYITDTKIPELEALHGGDLPYTFTPGENYGTIDYTTGGITDWEVLDSTSALVYKYEGLNWDSDTTITNLITDFAFGNNYLKKPQSGIGLILYRDTLVTSKESLEEDRDNLNESKTVFGNYI